MWNDLKRIVLVFALLFLFASILSGCTKPEPQPISNPGQNAMNPHMFQTTIPPEKLGPPTVLPKDVKPEDWVKDYYEAYKNGDFEKAYRYLPALNKARETTEAFKSSRQQMQITSYKIERVEETTEGTATIVRVPVTLESNGMTFKTTWIFEKQPDGSFIVKATQTAIGNQ